MTDFVDVAGEYAAAGIAVVDGYMMVAAVVEAAEHSWAAMEAVEGILDLEKARYHRQSEG